MPYRRDKTDLAGVDRAAVAAAAAARAGLVTCRRCPVPLDAVLTAAGFTAHPCCDPREISPDCPPMDWPAGTLTGPGRPAGKRNHRWPRHDSSGGRAECRNGDTCADCGLPWLNRAGRPCTGRPA